MGSNAEQHVAPPVRELTAEPAPAAGHVQLTWRVPAGLFDGYLLSTRDAAGGETVIRRLTDPAAAAVDLPLPAAAVTYCVRTFRGARVSVEETATLPAAVWELLLGDLT
jgi:redox-sensitive bicupin YhaK (pirin superfamily)